MRAGFSNMVYGVFIAGIGLLVTGLTYSMASGSGGTYVVATGAFVVGAWRFLLGLFQVLRGAISSQGHESRIPSQPTSSTGRAASPLVSAPNHAGAMQIIAGLLIVDAALRVAALGFLVSRFYGTALFDNPFFLAVSVGVPAALAIGAAVAGVALLRSMPTAPTLGIALCAAGLLFQAFGLVQLMSRSIYNLPLLAWATIILHIVIYISGLVVLLRTTNGASRSLSRA